MQKDSSTQMTKAQFSLEAVKERKVSLEEEFNSLNLYEDRIPIRSREKSPEHQIYSQMIPFSSDKRGNEPNSFHF